MKRLVAGLGLAVVLALPSAAGASVGTPSYVAATTAMQYAGASVSIVDFAFSPSYVEIPAGGSVSWYNAGGAPHTVTSSSGAFGSGTISPGGGYGVTLTVPGTYTYYCSIHPSMAGTIVVTGM
jgi:plastocyanin